MPTEKDIQDIYNRPPAGEIEYDEFTFSSLENDDLFWRTNVGVDTNPHRKINENQAMDLKTRQLFDVSPHTKVYIKV